MDKRQFHQESVKQLLKLRRDLYAMEAKAIKTAKRVRVYLRAGNKEQAEAHREAATNMALMVDFFKAEIMHTNKELARVLAA